MFKRRTIRLIARACLAHIAADRQAAQMPARLDKLS
jgi:hypothetical protein